MTKLKLANVPSQGKTGSEKFCSPRQQLGNEGQKSQPTFLHFYDKYSYKKSVIQLKYINAFFQLNQLKKHDEIGFDGQK